MPLYIADYHADTTHLTRGEHGAYLLLLMAMWRAGGRLPGGDQKLARLAMCSAEEWAEMRATILDFFKRRGGSIIHKRLSSEMARYQRTRVARSEAGKASQAKRGNKNNEKTPDLLQQNSTNQNQNQNQKERKKEPPSVVVRATRLSPDWTLDAIDKAYALGKGLIDADAVAEQFRDYWISKPGAAATKLDWRATWRTWVTTEIKRQGQRPKPKLVDWC